MRKPYGTLPKMSYTREGLQVRAWAPLQKEWVTVHLYANHLQGIMQFVKDCTDTANDLPEYMVSG